LGISGPFQDDSAWIISADEYVHRPSCGQPGTIVKVWVSAPSWRA
jgi:hypothetical protein